MINVKCKSSSLVETIVAMTLLSIVTGVFLMIYLNVFKSSTSVDTVKAVYLSEEIIHNEKNEMNFEDKNYSVDSLKISIEYEDVDEDNLILCILRVHNTKKQLLLTRKEYFYDEDDK